MTIGTVREAASVEPEAGDTDSQLAPPARVVARAVQLICPWPILRTPTVCAGTTPPPATAVNVSPVCESRIVCRPVVTVADTGTRTIPDGRLMETLPV